MAAGRDFQLKSLTSKLPGFSTGSFFGEYLWLIFYLEVRNAPASAMGRVWSKVNTGLVCPVP